MLQAAKTIDVELQLEVFFTLLPNLPPEWKLHIAKTILASCGALVQCGAAEDTSRKRQEEVREE